MEVNVTDRNVDQIVNECARYWRDTGVPSERVGEMRDELADHLTEATAAGQSVDSVVGPDLAVFAEAWAAAYRGSARVNRHENNQTRSSALWIWLTIGLLGITFAAVAILAPKGADVDAEQWRWIWVAAAVILSIGELLTVGFFLLPFAVGAAAAAILAFIGVSVPIQLVTFVVISVIFLAVLQRFAKREQESDVPAQAGADRYVGRNAIVLEPVHRFDTGGMVKMGTEEWRAKVDSDIEIPTGAVVRIVEVRGTRFVVEPIPPSTE
jgi:membrane protein implicated in regulation of membrane protease activity/DNA-binding ferritin-like protein (Dps family)